MTKQEKNYLEGKINNRLSSVKVQLDYQLKQYAKDGKHSYSFRDFLSSVNSNMEDIKIYKNKIDTII